MTCLRSLLLATLVILGQGDPCDGMGPEDGIRLPEDKDAMKQGDKDNPGTIYKLEEAVVRDLVNLGKKGSQPRYLKDNKFNLDVFKQECDAQVGTVIKYKNDNNHPECTDEHAQFCTHNWKAGKFDENENSGFKDDKASCEENNSQRNQSKCVLKEDVLARETTPICAVEQTGNTIKCTQSTGKAIASANKEDIPVQGCTFVQYKYKTVQDRNKEDKVCLHPASNMYTTFLDQCYQGSKAAQGFNFFYIECRQSGEDVKDIPAVMKKFPDWGARDLEKVAPSLTSLQADLQELHNLLWV